ncbi:MAG: type II secretion system major pseudopilin GspG [Chromatiales bacterium]|nr:type II secretion system major pseudopilin GspG [Chromatiales bacterium]
MQQTHAISPSCGRHQHGFTLIEVIVVVVILAILAAAIIPNVVDEPERAAITRAKTDIRTLESALEIYRANNFHYPSTDQGLQALIEKPTGMPEPRNWKTGGYIKRLPNDPWGNPYLYLNPGQRGEIDIYSLGPDQQPSDDDIGNWNLE